MFRTDGQKNAFCLPGSTIGSHVWLELLIDREPAGDPPMTRQPIIAVKVIDRRDRDTDVLIRRRETLKVAAMRCRPEPGRDDIVAVGEQSLCAEALVGNRGTRRLNAILEADEVECYALLGIAGVMMVRICPGQIRRLPRRTNRPLIRKTREDVLICL